MAGEGKAPFSSAWLNSALAPAPLYKGIQHGNNEGAGATAFNDWFFGATGTTSYVITPIGGITIEGNGLFLKEKVFIPTGGITFTGSGVQSQGKIFTVSGGVVFAGTGNMTASTGGGSAIVPERTKTGVGT